MKHLVTSGCSFSDGYKIERWPQQLSYLIEEEHELYNYGMASKGNDWISKSIIYQVDKLLKSGIDPDDINVVAMWSGPDRKGLWISKDETHGFEKLKLEKSYRCMSNPSNFMDKSFLPINKPECDIIYECEGPGYLAGSFGCKFNENIHRWRDVYNKQFHTHEGTSIETYEHFLRLQWYLDVHGIKYFFMTFMNILAWPHYYMVDNIKLTKDLYASVEPLYNMVNWDKWWFHNEVEGLYEYCVYNDLDLTDDNFHPTDKSHVVFTADVVYPMAKKFLNIK